VQQHAATLSADTRAPLDLMRLNQGIIQGLQLAQQILDERYRKLHGG
jgi:hypothetical protein